MKPRKSILNLGNANRTKTHNSVPTKLEADSFSDSNGRAHSLEQFEVQSDVSSNVSGIISANPKIATIFNRDGGETNNMHDNAVSDEGVYPDRSPFGENSLGGSRTESTGGFGPEDQEPRIIASDSDQSTKDEGKSESTEPSYSVECFTENDSRYNRTDIMIFSQFKVIHSIEKLTVLQLINLFDECFYELDMIMKCGTHYSFQHRRFAFCKIVTTPLHHSLTVNQLLYILLGQNMLDGIKEQSILEMYVRSIILGFANLMSDSRVDFKIELFLKLGLKSLAYDLRFDNDYFVSISDPKLLDLSLICCSDYVWV